jgi:hypothetical protein
MSLFFAKASLASRSAADLRRFGLRSMVRHYLRHPLFVCVLATVLAGLLPACARRPVAPIAHAMPPSVLVPAGQAGIRDDRGRFREIMAAIMADHGALLPGDRPTDGDGMLWHLSGEPGPTGRPVPLGPSTAGIRLVLVPGLLAECVSESSLLFDDARPDVERYGYATTLVRTGGRWSSARNAAIIHEVVEKLPKSDTIVFVTHSKGAVDVLEALVAYPDLVARTAAVVSVAGAVNGSPLAETFSDGLLRFAESMPLSSCPPGQGTEALDSLKRANRLRFLAEHTLPASVRYYSLAAFATRQDTSAILRPFYDILAKTDPLNDGLVIAADAVIPGATLLGYPNADHVAVAMPFTKKYSLLTAVNSKNSYPRAALLEAVARYVEEDLHREKGKD